MEIGLRQILDKILPEARLDLAYSDELEAQLAAIARGSSYAVARTFRVIDPESRHPATGQWNARIKF